LGIFKESTNQSIIFKMTKDNLITYIQSFVDLTTLEMESFTELFKEVHLKKDDYFAQQGEFSTSLGFLNKGVMRAFYRNSWGKEYNKTFFTDSNFVAAYVSITTKQRNSINIQCLTNCRVLVADYQKVSTLYAKYPKIESLARRLAEYKFALKEKREIELATLDASTRYEIFRKEHAGLENLINQYHIASYLSVTPTQLSRIRSKF